MLRFKFNTLIIHIAGWLLFMLLPLLFLNSGQKSNSEWLLLTSSFYWLFCLTYLGLFYFNWLYLIPNFFLKNRYLIYTCCVATLLVGVYFLQPFDKLLGHNPRFDEQLKVASAAQKGLPGMADTTPVYFGPLPHQDMRMQEPPKPIRSNPLWEHSPDVDAVSLILFFIITALALSVRTVEQWHATEQKVVVAESEKVNAELSFLKAQINPHFLFNTLNNIYTLSVMQSEHTSESIMKLSNIMRYVTDEVSQDLVPLQDDLACIKNYIDLQRLRLGRKTQVDYQVTGEVTNQKIAPLILMSFVENAFKYGVSKQKNSIIKIHIRIKEAVINFCCENSVFHNQTNVAERTGIGIANTRQRLQHLYTDRHMLNIEEKDNRFTVKLTLQG